jgi:hypothetical protein
MKTILKKIAKIIVLLTIYCLQINAFAQAPQKMSYQAVLRDNNNTLIVNTTVGVKISIIDALQPFVPIAYAESHTTTTNANGLVSLEIGGGTVISGVFSNINWGSGSFSVKTETDPTGGTNYTIVGTSQLLSVPYALSSGDSKWVSNPNGINNISGNVGIGTTTPSYKLDILHPSGEGMRIKSSSGYSVLDIDARGGDAAIRFAENGTNQWIMNSGTDDNSFNIGELGSAGGTRIRINEGTGNVGIGIINPTFKLHVDNSQNSMRIEGPTNPGGKALSIGGNGKVEVDAPGFQGKRFNIQENGNIGIGTSTPNAPLQFPNTIANRKIVLWENANNDNQYYGFGINGGTLRYQVADEVADHAFFAGTSSTTSKELLRIKGNGAIAVNGNMGEAGQVLTSAGAGAPATWSNVPKQYSKSYYDPGYQWKGLPVTVSTPTTLTSLSQTITTSADISRALISYNLLYAKEGCSVPFGCNPTATIYLYVNGSIVNAKKINLTSDALDYSEITLSNFAYNLIAGTNTIEIKVQKDNVLVNNFLVYQQSVSAVVYPE